MYRHVLYINTYIYIYCFDIILYYYIVDRSSMQEIDPLKQDTKNRFATNNVTSSRFTKIKQRIVLVYLSIITTIIINSGQKLGEIQRKAISIAIPIFRAHQAKYCQKTKSQWLKLQVWYKIYGYFQFLAQLSSIDMFNMGPNEIMAPRMKLSAQIQQFYDYDYDANVQQQNVLEQSQRQEKECNIQCDYPTDDKMIQQIEYKFIKGYIEQRLGQKRKQSRMKKNEIKIKQGQRNNRQISNNNSSNLTKLKQRFTKLYLMKLPYLLQQYINKNQNQIKILALILTLIDFIHFHDNKPNVKYNLLQTLNKLQLKSQFLIFIHNLFNFHTSSNQNITVRIRDLLSNDTQAREQLTQPKLEERMEAVQKLEKMIQVVQVLVDDKGFFRAFGGFNCINFVKMYAWDRLRQLVIYFKKVHEWITKNSLILILNISWIISSVYVFYLSFGIKLPISLSIQPLIHPNTSQPNTPQNLSSPTPKYYNMTCQQLETFPLSASGIGTNNIILILLFFINILLPTTICCSYLYTRQKTQSIVVESCLFEEYVDSSDSSQCEQEMEWCK